MSCKGCYCLSNESLGYNGCDTPNDTGWQCVEVRKRVFLEQGSTRNSARGSPLKTALARVVSDYGMVLVLALLCVFFSYVTWDEQPANGAKAGERLAARILSQEGAAVHVMVVARVTDEDAAFADAVERALAESGARVVATVRGEPADARQALDRLAEADGGLDVIVCNEATVAWRVFKDFEHKYPRLAGTRFYVPESYWWPNFLEPGNLLNSLTLETQRRDKGAKLGGRSLAGHYLRHHRGGLIHCQ